MKKVIKLDNIPEKSLILNGFGKINYSDTYKIQITANGLIVSPQIFGELIVTEWFKIRTGLSYNFCSFKTIYKFRKKIKVKEGMKNVVFN